MPARARPDRWDQALWDVYERARQVSVSYGDYLDQEDADDKEALDELHRAINAMTDAINSLEALSD